MKKVMFVLCGVALMGTLPMISLGVDWSEDFDNYAAGTLLHSVGGGSGWDGNPNVARRVTSDQA